MCTEVRKRYKADFIPIIMVSANGNPNDVMMGLDCGANDYVKKPFHRKELLSRIRAQIRSRCVHRSIDPEGWEGEGRGRKELLSRIRAQICSRCMRIH